MWVWVGGWGGVLTKHDFKDFLKVVLLMFLDERSLNILKLRYYRPVFVLFTHSNNKLGRL